MCNLYEVGPAPEQVQLEWELPFLDAIHGLPYVAPGSTGLVGRSAASGLEPVRMRWGFRRSWSTAINNARDDKLAGPMWRDAWAHRRCLIPMRRFFEWSGTAGRKTKHAIRPADTAATWFWAGGIWEEDPGSAEGACYSLITTPASPSMRPLHDRMPLLLRHEEAMRFLREGEASSELVRPFPDALWIDPSPGGSQEPEPWF